MVSNVHNMGTKDEAVIQPQKKPQINEFNGKHIQLVWEYRPCGNSQDTTNY